MLLVACVHAAYTAPTACPTWCSELLLCNRADDAEVKRKQGMCLNHADCHPLKAACDALYFPRPPSPPSNPLATRPSDGAVAPRVTLGPARVEPAPALGGGIAGAPSDTLGWVMDTPNNVVPPALDEGGALTLTGDTRLYMVEDFASTAWRDHSYTRLDLSGAGLRFEVDLSSVPCGCVACLYLVAMRDPDSAGDSSNYCDTNFATELGEGDKLVPLPLCSLSLSLYLIYTYP
jgi:hypothetical protein